MGIIASFNQRGIYDLESLKLCPKLWLAGGRPGIWTQACLIYKFPILYIYTLLGLKT